MLYRPMRVVLASERVLKGDFTCLDKQGNLILSNTVEEVVTPGGKAEERHMGLVLVPVQQQRKVELLVSMDEELGMLALMQ
ncbi:hypothetical protein TSOC_008561 [Tetrabaena socialis]|uniref:Sm domain-containing protein n=1 Tax=Tetrabaena socialis TaxID=47790 RepID=A0A2J7ZY73_9CHLO|nr:hypothetical protein TSOC_008561 [Tetrabaena socialis]|eukprot:PNH05205.1 hypothetical protein TSOC_008561 [Tetrabaena socialis]